MCFVLESVFTARIIKNFTGNKFTITITSILFTITPVMIWRMYIHTALAGHWVLLMALEPLFIYEKYCENKKIYIKIGLVGVFAASVHLYFVLMCGIILVGICIEDIAVNKRIIKSIILLVIYLLCVGMSIGILGGFSSGVTAKAANLGMYSLN